ncbi:MCE family protein [Nocardia jinanensis]|uniref:Mammalian cell entry protein n=1 Tax=Nocardia jinanensis TaxID=382504 RepID=A0A917RKT6_9NOCA|nr:MlaD family protein [Nocardia jinanensis]GGL13178.1 mammalian cell entry protein [Nocardia jinanensis]
MKLTTFVRTQLIIFTILTVISLTVMSIQFMQIPALFGVGRYQVKVELSYNANLYETANVTYRGETVGQVVGLQPAPHGVTATVSLFSRVEIPADLDAAVHSRSAIGEQYIDLAPRTTEPPYLRDGDVVPVDRTSVPQDIGPLIDTVARSLDTLPQGNLQTLIDESYLAFHGTGPSLARLLDASHALVGSTHDNLPAITSLLTDSGPVLDAVAASDPAIRSWAQNVAALTGQLSASDQRVRGLLVSGRAAADQATALFQQLRPTTPILLANLVGLGQVAVTYNASLEQLLVLLPQGASQLDVSTFPDRETTNAAYLSFNLNLNLPEPCTVGYLPPEQRRDGSAEDAPPRPAQPLYCALPQSAPNVVRGARNYPCMDHPGKRAPTIEICKSDQDYQPQGTNPWIGDSQPYLDNPEYRPSAYSEGAPSAPPDATPAVDVATYDPSDGSYVGSDGRSYTLHDVAPAAAATRKESSWQTMLNPAL